MPLLAELRKYPQVVSSMCRAEMRLFVSTAALFCSSFDNDLNAFRHVFVNFFPNLSVVLQVRKVSRSFGVLLLIPQGILVRITLREVLIPQDIPLITLRPRIFVNKSLVSSKRIVFETSLSWPYYRCSSNTTRHV